ncbi:MAG: hypothetical protein M0036_16350 [Desulfobacteraceae bacterium]|nr:hypothetical protein [Desulfobacteraceae bacterium]
MRMVARDLIGFFNAATVQAEVHPAEFQSRQFRAIWNKKEYSIKIWRPAIQEEMPKRSLKLKKFQSIKVDLP